MDGRTELPKNMDRGTELPKNMDGGTGLPKNMDGRTELPKNMDVGTELPKNMDGRTELPKNMDGGTELPKNMDGGTELPKNMDGGTGIPKDGNEGTELNMDEKSELPKHRDGRTGYTKDMDGGTGQTKDMNGDNGLTKDMDGWTALNKDKDEGTGPTEDIDVWPATTKDMDGGTGQTKNIYVWPATTKDMDGGTGLAKYVDRVQGDRDEVKTPNTTSNSTKIEFKEPKPPVSASAELDPTNTVIIKIETEETVNEADTLPVVNLIYKIETEDSQENRFKDKMSKSDSEYYKTLAKTDIGLGQVLEKGRTLLYYLLKNVNNGDILALSKLNSAIEIEENEDDLDDPEILIDHSGLVDERFNTNNILKDLLDIPRSKTVRILKHPVMETFIKTRWRKTKWIFITTFLLYLTFLILFSTFLGMMFFRTSHQTTHKLDALKFRQQCPNFQSEKKNPLSKFRLALPEGQKGALYNVVEKVISSRIGSRKRDHLRTFDGCRNAAFPDIPLCSVEIMLTIVLIVLMIEETWECLALGLRYFTELESWIKILVFSFAAISLSYETEIEILKIFSSSGICMSWLELIFMIGRYPFLGGRFSIMFYSISKRIVQSALAFFIMVVAFGFAFFIINFGSDNEQFENPGKALLKIFVMVLGEFEFDNLYEGTYSSDSTLIFSMLLLIGLMVAGSVIMLNLIVAFIITDVSNLMQTSWEQVVINQVNICHNCLKPF